MQSHTGEFREQNLSENSFSIARSMSLVYFWMVFGLMITGLLAYLIWRAPATQAAILGNGPVLYTLLALQFLLVIIFSLGSKHASFLLAISMFVSISALNGMTLSVLFLVYQIDSIIFVFISTSFAFLGLAFIGYKINYDLTPIETFCLHGLLGLIGCAVFSFFLSSLRSNLNQLALSAVGVIIFSGLTASTSQKIKKKIATRNLSFVESINYSLDLYLNFINLFLEFMRISGKRR